MEGHNNHIDTTLLASTSNHNALRVRGKNDKDKNSESTCLRGPNERQQSLPGRKYSLSCTSSQDSLHVTLTTEREDKVGYNQLIREMWNFLRLLSFSTDTLLNSSFFKRLKNLTWGQTVLFIMIGFTLYYTDSFSQRVDGPLVKTKLGVVKGTTGISRRGRVFYEYLGIPYAKAPVGELRFEPTQPAEPWAGIRDASSYGNKCVQIDLLLGMIGGDEDCLFINIHTPVKSRKAKLPVIMYVHGGFFHNGGGSFWRPSYFMDEDIILVTFNYRLNSLGFLNTGDGVIRGNQGLKDQTMALIWLKENIVNFGGDPNRLTILGESAGGSAAHLHMYSNMSTGLFHNVISESGSGLHFWAVNREPRKQALRFLKQLGCPADNKTEMVACLKSASAYDIAEIHREVLDPLREEITIYKPSVEQFVGDGNTFLAEHPKDLAQKGTYNKVPWIFGVNSEEGLITSAAILANDTMAKVAKNDWKLFIERVLWFHSSNGIAAEKIRQFYFGNDAPRLHPDPFQTLDNYTTMISDRGFNYDAHHGARLQSQHSVVYLYYYSYRGEWSAVTYFKAIRGAWPRLVEVGWAIAAAWIRKNVLGQPLTNYGASHSDELALLFQMPGVSDVTPDCNDYEMSVDFIRLFADFARNGGEKQNYLKFRNVLWEPVQPQTNPMQYLRIDREAAMIPEPFTKRIRFWDSLLAKPEDLQYRK